MSVDQKVLLFMGLACIGLGAIVVAIGAMFLAGSATP